MITSAKGSRGLANEVEGPGKAGERVLAEPGAVLVPREVP